MTDNRRILSILRKTDALQAEIVQYRRNGRVEIMVEIMHGGQVVSTAGPFEDQDDGDMRASELLNAAVNKLSHRPAVRHIGARK